jgi:hypothetical protein
MTIETEENIVRFSSVSQRPILMWCPSCRREVEMVTPEQAAKIAGASSRTIYHWIEMGKVHFGELTESLLVICRDSLESSNASRKV